MEVEYVGGLSDSFTGQELTSYNRRAVNVRVVSVIRALTVKRMRKKPLKHLGLVERTTGRKERSIKGQ
jgi:hypothetical protein